MLLELKAKDRWIEIAEIARIIRRDLGATVQILRMTGSASAGRDLRSARIEECIADLGLDACIAGLSSTGSNSEDVSALWAHCREIAEQAALITEGLSNVDPAEVYLVGLLHAIDALPPLLGWTANADDKCYCASDGLALVEIWSLPCCIRDLFSVRAETSNAFRWRRLLREAHRRASPNSRSRHCSGYE